MIQVNHTVFQTACCSFHTEIVFSAGTGRQYQQKDQDLIYPHNNRWFIDDSNIDFSRYILTGKEIKKLAGTKSAHHDYFS